MTGFGFERKFAMTQCRTLLLRDTVHMASPPIVTAIILIMMLSSTYGVDVVLKPDEAVPNYRSWQASIAAGGSGSNSTFDPNRPLVLCSSTPSSFHTCTLNDLYGADMANVPAGMPGCEVWGPGHYGSAPNTTALCSVLDGIECYGPRSWSEIRECRRVTMFRFTTVMILSLIMGWLGVDRLYTSHIGLGVVKLLSLGGIGVWWLIDLVLLINGVFRPHDGSDWDVIDLKY